MDNRREWCCNKIVGRDFINEVWSTLLNAAQWVRKIRTQSSSATMRMPVTLVKPFSLELSMWKTHGYS